MSIVREGDRPGEGWEEQGPEAQCGTETEKRVNGFSETGYEATWSLTPPSPPALETFLSPHSLYQKHSAAVYGSKGPRRKEGPSGFQML